MGLEIYQFKVNFYPMQLTDYFTHFKIPHFLFLRKCVAIREQLQLMGYPNSKLQIRNIPVGSKNYYACFSECCYAAGYKVINNGRGEVIDVIPFSKLRLEVEVEDYQEVSIDDPDYYLHDSSVYPTAEPRNVELYVYDDEKIDFITSTDYILKKIQAAQAINEIENESAQFFVTTTQITTWLERHYELYWSMQLDYNVLAFLTFQNLYSQFQYLADDFKHMEKAQQAVDEYKPFDEAWLEKYDRLYFCALMGWECGYEIFHDDPFILKQEFSSIHLVGKEFGALNKFAKLFITEYYRST